MKVEIYGSAESHTVRGATVNFNADSAAPVTEFVAEVNPNGFDGRTGVDINKNGTTQSVAFGKTCYGGSANVTTGTLTEEYGGGAYDPQNVPAEVKSEVESKLTLETATPGDIVSFDCELGEYPLAALSFPLAPIQDLHGYDNPWPAGGGKNKLPNNATNETKSANGVQIKAENGVYTITGTPTAGDSITFDLVDSVDLSPSTNKIAFLNNVANAHVSVYFRRSGTNVHFWSMNSVNRVASGWTDSGNEVVNQISIYLDTAAGSNLNITVSPMLIATSETNPTSFFPYSNICPISGWTGAEVTRTGKSLLDSADFVKGSISGIGVDTQSGSRLRSPFVPVKPSTGYWALCNSEVTIYELHEYDANKNWIGYSGVSASSGTFTTRSSAAYEKVLIRKTDNASIEVSELTEFIFAEGTAVGDYEPYAGDTYSIIFPTEAGTVYGGTLDVTTGKLTVDRAMLGNVTWSKHNSYSHVFYAPAGTGQLVNSTTGVSNVCVLYSGGNLASFASDSQYRFRIGDRIYINIPSVSNVTELNTWITNNSFQICFELATPIVYDLTPTEIETLLGQNNVWCDAGEISELKYYDGDITDTDIQTENGVLVTGDKLFYALSSPRTSSFTPTAVNTVQGENTMSANTGNIAVTYTSNWFDITPWIAWQGLTFSRNDVDSPEAGRDMSGLMHRGRVSVKEKMNVQTIQLTRAQSSFLQTLLYPETIQVRVTPYPRTNAAQVMSMYTNNVKTTYVIHRQNGEDLQSLSFPLIEN